MIVAVGRSLTSIVISSESIKGQILEVAAVYLSVYVPAIVLVHDVDARGVIIVPVAPPVTSVQLLPVNGLGGAHEGQLGVTLNSVFKSIGVVVAPVALRRSKHILRVSTGNVPA